MKHYSNTGNPVNFPIPPKLMRARCEALVRERDPTAYSIVQHDEKNFSARVGHCMAYYVIIDGKIVGDVWYE